MPIRLKIDPGGEWLLPFAKKKLRELKAEMKRLGVKFRTQWFQITDAERIFLQSQWVAGDVWLDVIRISAGEGCIILQTNNAEYTVIKWDGSKIASLDSTGHPWSGFSMHEAIGTQILFSARSGPSNGTAYVVEAKDFSTVYGPEDFSAYAFGSFTFRQPPAVGDVLPARQWAAGPSFGSLTSLSGADIGLTEIDLTSLSLASLSGALSTGSGVNSGFNWNGGSGDSAIIDLGRDTAPSDKYEFARVNMVSGVATRVEMAGSNAGGTESVFPICTNSTMLLRTFGNGTGAYVEARSLADGSLIGRAFLTDAVDATNLTWKVLRCDERRAIVIFGEGFSPTAYLGFVVDLAALTAKDITGNLNAGLTLVQLGNTDLSRAIILDAKITGAIVAPPEGGGDEGGGGPRD